MSAPYWTDHTTVLHIGDCRDVLRLWGDECVDAIVTDPPYELTSGGTGGGFMGQRWDSTGVAFDPATWREVLRVLKPGGWLLAFGGTRTWHRLVCAIEDAGFEIRDCVADLTGQDAPGLAWVQGQGFPKSLDMSKAIDKAAGAERQVLAAGQPVKRMIPGADQNRTGSWIKDDGREFVPTVTEPATADAATWNGWGTALKPAWEPIAVARKPLAGTVTRNVLEHGTGALNLAACAVPHAGAADRAESEGKNRHADFGSGPIQNRVFGAFERDRDNYDGSDGRWPPNLIVTHAADCRPAGTKVVRTDGHHPASRGAGGISTSGHAGQDELAERKSGAEVVEAWDCAPGCPAAELDRQSGTGGSGGGRVKKSSGRKSGRGSWTGSGMHAAGAQNTGIRDFGDAGGASRFFPAFRYHAKANAAERPRLADGTVHPTVKPVDVVAWLVRLVTRPGALVLDPFAGSGTTGQACIAEGRRCVLIENDARYADLIVKRLSKPVQTAMFDAEEAL